MWLGGVIERGKGKVDGALAACTAVPRTLFLEHLLLSVELLVADFH